ncbi:hypothetical protein JYT72_00750 [Crocinitomix catalasitica]|nr:hypothetical protein [Crocinitomix catalasitica]
MKSPRTIFLSLILFFLAISCIKKEQKIQGDWELTNCFQDYRIDDQNGGFEQYITRVDSLGAEVSYHSSYLFMGTWYEWDYDINYEYELNIIFDKVLVLGTVSSDGADELISGNWDISKSDEGSILELSAIYENQFDWHPILALDFIILQMTSKDMVLIFRGDDDNRNINTTLWFSKLK